MQLGIMTRMYQRLSIEEIADAVRADGLTAVQLNLANAGLPALPDALDPAEACRIGDVFRSRGLSVAAVSGTFNTIHPDPGVRQDGVRRAAVIASRCAELGTRVITLCSGTRDPASMWRYHPANSQPDAWRDLVETTHRLVEATEGTGVYLGYEPEVVNVVDSAVKARRLLDEIGSPRLGVVLDPANLIHPSDLDRSASVIEDAFEHLAGRIVLAHAKDIAEPEAGARECRRVAPGTGKLNFAVYLRLLLASGYTGALVMHDLAENEVTSCAAKLRAWGAC